MRYISVKEYQSLINRQGKDLSLGYIYQLMKKGKIPCVEKPITKVHRLIPWDDDKNEVCQVELVAQ